jgi:hypothetical protein
LNSSIADLLPVVNRSSIDHRRVDSTRPVKRRMAKD